MNVTTSNSNEPTAEQMEKLKQCVETLRANDSKSEEIVKAFASLLLMPTILRDNERLEKIGVSRKELQRLSKRHAESFHAALKSFIRDMTKMSRH